MWQTEQLSPDVCQGMTALYRCQVAVDLRGVGKKPSRRPRHPILEAFLPTIPHTTIIINDFKESINVLFIIPMPIIIPKNHRTVSTENRNTNNGSKKTIKKNRKTCQKLQVDIHRNILQILIRQHSICKIIYVMASTVKQCPINLVN